MSRAKFGHTWTNCYKKYLVAVCDIVWPHVGDPKKFWVLYPSTMGWVLA